MLKIKYFKITQKQNETLKTYQLTNLKTLLEELTAFVHVWLFHTGVIPSIKAMNIPSNKGKPEESKNGVNNLILAAFTT